MGDLGLNQGELQSVLRQLQSGIRTEVPGAVTLAAALGRGMLVPSTLPFSGSLKARSCMLISPLSTRTASCTASTSIW